MRVLAKMEDAGIGVDRGYLEELGRACGIASQRWRSRCIRPRRTLQYQFDTPASRGALRTPRTSRAEARPPRDWRRPTPRCCRDSPTTIRWSTIFFAIANSKLRSTYVDGLLPLIDADGRIHCVFNQTGASTGRISSEQPNMQNIPVRSEEGRTIHRAFVAAQGHLFVVADYSQIELRILAHLCGDAALVEAFRSGADLHTATASRVFGVEGSEVTPEMRRRAKVINFGLLYGMRRTDSPNDSRSQEEARQQMEAYFSQFPGVRAFMESIVVEARNTGYTETILGQAISPGVGVGELPAERQAGERMALNAPIQGSAADIIKQAMIVLDERLGDRGGDAAPGTRRTRDRDSDRDQPEVSTTIREVMERVVELRVPLVAEVGVGSNLADARH